MPRFYFHIRSKYAREVDTDGIEFNDLAEAVRNAQDSVREIMAEPSLAVVDADSVFEIADVSGKILAEIPFKPLGASDGD